MDKLLKLVLGTLLGFLILMPAMAYKAHPITTCEMAKASNRAARNWSVMKPPANDIEYANWINASPWCSYVPAKDGKSNHKSIMHHYSRGTGHEIQVQKVGELRWIKKNWRKLQKDCMTPYGYTKRKLKYQRDPSKQCWTEIKAGPHFNYIHQWGVSKNGKKAKQRHKNAMPPLDLSRIRNAGGNKRRR